MCIRDSVNTDPERKHQPLFNHSESRRVASQFLHQSGEQSLVDYNEPAGCPSKVSDLLHR
eukprot:2449444-Pyramimonas_sp.AAC.1